MDRVGEHDDEHVGRGGRLLLRRPAAARRAAPTRLKVRSMVGLLPLCASTVVRRARCVEQLPAAHASASRAFIERAPGADRQHRTARREPGHRRPAPARAPRRGQAAPRARAHARRERVPEPLRHPLRSRASTATTPTSSASAAQEYRVDYLPGGVDHAACSAATRTGAGRSGCRSTSLHHPRAAAALRVLRRRLHGRVPDRLGAADDPVRGGRRRSRARLARDLPARRARAPPGATAAPRSSRTIRTGATCILFYEYFHGDNGAGIGASHQTGWTGLVAPLIQIFGSLDAATYLERGTQALARQAPAPRNSVTALASPRYPSLYQINTRLGSPSSARTLGPPGDARRFPGRRARPARRGRVRLGLAAWACGRRARPVARFPRTQPDWQARVPGALARPSRPPTCAARRSPFGSTW